MFNYNRMESMIAQSGKTKLHLCRAMGVSKTYLRDAKTQGTDISGEKLHILAAELNTTPEYLRGETDDPGIKKKRPPTRWWTSVSTRIPRGLSSCTAS